MDDDALDQHTRGGSASAVRDPRPRQSGRARQAVVVASWIMTAEDDLALARRSPVRPRPLERGQPDHGREEVDSAPYSRRTSILPLAIAAISQP